MRSYVLSVHVGRGRSSAAGHNGLVCAFYLARAGLSVRVFEARDVVGGAAVTEEFHPGFRNSVASYTVSLLQPKVIADMRLPQRGYRVIERPISNFLPQEDGRLPQARRRARAHPGRVPQVLDPRCRGAARLLRDARDGRRRAARPRAQGAAQRRRRAAHADRRRRCRAAGSPGCTLEQKRDVLELFTKSARELPRPWFESEAVKAAFGFDAVVGNYAIARHARARPTSCSTTCSAR